MKDGLAKRAEDRPLRLSGQAGREMNKLSYSHKTSPLPESIPAGSAPKVATMDGAD
jgi:hypothetical protein